MMRDNKDNTKKLWGFISTVVLHKKQKLKKKNHIPSSNSTFNLHFWRRSKYTSKFLSESDQQFSSHQKTRVLL